MNCPSCNSDMTKGLAGIRSAYRSRAVFLKSDEPESSLTGLAEKILGKLFDNNKNAKQVLCTDKGSNYKQAYYCDVCGICIIMAEKNCGK